MNRCAATAAEFKRWANMSPQQIRSWAIDPRRRCASFPATLARLPRLAELKAKPAERWTQADCALGARATRFNKRMQGNVDAYGCGARNVVALRNWGRHPPKCAMPAHGCPVVGKQRRR